MGKINEYSAMGAAPASNDLLFIGDTDASYQIKSITIANLNKMADLAAVNSSGLSIKDDGGNYGIFIKDGGNVGIGTATPDYELDISATNPVLGITAGASGDAIIRFDQTTTQQATIGYDDTGDLLKLNNNSNFGGTNHLVINTDGNVGIGETAPTSTLHIGDGSATPSLRVEGASSYSVYLYTDGTNGPGLKGGAHALHIQRGYGGGAGANLYCFYKTSAPVTPLMIQSEDGNVGIGTNTPAGTLQIDTAVDDALYIHSRDAAKPARIKLSVTTSAAGYITDTAGYMTISGNNVAAANNCLQISKGGTTNGGRLSIGGVLGTFSYALTTVSSPATQASFTSSHATRGYLYITNNQSTTGQTAIIFGNAQTNSPRWMAGQFFTSTPSENYFSWNYLGDTALASNSPNSATFSPSSSALESNTAYCSQTGGLSCENTSVAFGHIQTDSSTSTSNLTATYNMQDPVTLSAAGIATIDFSKKLTSDKYTVIATGWDGTRPLVGYASTKGEGSVAITFYRLDTGAAIDLTASAAIELDFVVYGGSSSGVDKDVMLQTRLEKAAP